MAPIPVTLSDLEGYFAVFWILNSLPRQMWHVLTVICLRMNWKANVASDVNCFIKTDGLFKVAGSHVHCKNDVISETVQDRDAVTTDCEQEVICDLSNTVKVVTH